MDYYILLLYQYTTVIKIYKLDKKFFVIFLYPAGIPGGDAGLMGRHSLGILGILGVLV